MFIQPETQQQRLNNFARFLCLVRGHQLSNIRWRKNGKTVFPNNCRIKVSTNTTANKTVLIDLTITSVVRNDNGTYECEAFSELGNLTKKSNLLVLGMVFVNILLD